MIRSELSDSILRITLDRADQRNALTTEMIDGLVTAISSCQPATRALLLTGEGSIFCAGFDLNSCNQTPDGSILRHLLRSLLAAVQQLRNLHCPVVIACQGGAIAGGCALLTAADVVVADRKAVFGYPVLRLGLSPAVSLPTLAQTVGYGPARTRALDVDLISADRAQEISLIHHVVETSADVLPAATLVAQKLASKPPEVMAITRQWLRQISPITDAELRSGLEASLQTAGTAEQANLLHALLAGKRRS